MDVKLQDKDMVLDSTGNPVYIEGLEEILQRAVICITTRRGSFIYNKSMGLDTAGSVSDEQSICDLEAQLREAVLSLEGVTLTLNSAEQLTDNSLRANITLASGNEKISAEVII